MLGDHATTASAAPKESKGSTKARSIVHIPLPSLALAQEQPCIELRPSMLIGVVITQRMPFCRRKMRNHESGRTRGHSRNAGPEASTGRFVEAPRRPSLVKESGVAASKTTPQGPLATIGKFT
jgi:hypothetical protein